MRIIGCDLHARQPTLAMLDSTTGEIVNLTLRHEGDNVREFYSNLPRPVRVGIEATRSMQWFVNLMEELGIECMVGHPGTIQPASLEIMRFSVEMIHLASRFEEIAPGLSGIRKVRSASQISSGWLVRTKPPGGGRYA